MDCTLSKCLIYFIYTFTLFGMPTLPTNCLQVCYMWSFQLVWTFNIESSLTSGGVWLWLAYIQKYTRCNAWTPTLTTFYLLSEVVAIKQLSLCQEITIFQFIFGSVLFQSFCIVFIKNFWKWLIRLTCFI